MRVSSERWRGHVTFIVACLMHVAAHFALRSTTPASVAAVSLEQAPPDEFDLALDPPSPEPPLDESAKMAASTRVVAGSKDTGEAAPSPALEGAPSSPENVPRAGTDTEGGPTPAGSAWTFRPTTPNLVPSAAELLALNGGRAVAETAAPLSTTGGLVESLDAADVERGLGRGGSVRTAIELAARRENAPVRGSATFSVTIFSDGKVDVQVASNQTDWSRLIPAVVEAVRKAHVRLPPKSRGLNVVVSVEAKVKYPDGYEPPADKTEVTGDVALAADKPWVDIHARGRRCWARLEIAAGGLAGGADCAPGTTLRAVSTRIVSEQRL